MDCCFLHIVLAVLDTLALKLKFTCSLSGRKVVSVGLFQYDLLQSLTIGWVVPQWYTDVRKPSLVKLLKDRVNKQYLLPLASLNWVLTDWYTVKLSVHGSEASFGANCHCSVVLYSGKLLWPLKGILFEIGCVYHGTHKWIATQRRYVDVIPLQYHTHTHTHTHPQ